jgi:Tfp pilus assembly protein PilV
MRSSTAKPSSADQHRTRVYARSERGDSLIEVLASTVLLAVIIVATLTGLDSANRSTTLDRARSQADALAQQEQEQLRSEPVKKLSELTRVKKVTLNGTEYTITTNAVYYPNASATSSCNSSSAAAEDIKTTSRVTWPSMGASKAVEEVSMISPPAGTALIVQVTNPVEPLAGAVVSVVGPTTASAETSSNGCAILALEPGSYTIDVTKAGYVDQNGFEHTKQDTAGGVTTDYLVAETTTKLQYTLAPASKLEVSFSGAVPAESDTVVMFNSSMVEPARFGTLGTYKTVVSSPNNVFPFAGENKYAVYAGTCEGNLPSKWGQTNVEVLVPPASTTKVTVAVPPVPVKVMSGISEASPGTAVEKAEVKVKDLSCKTTANRMLTTNASGTLTHPGLPYGEYTFCAGNAKASGRHWEGTLLNNSPTGPTSKVWTNGGEKAGVDTIYLGTSPAGAPAGTKEGLCP